MKPMALLISHTTLFAAAVALGWGVRGEAPVASAATAPTRTAPAPSTQVGPLIAISDDGRATLRVEQQPLDWVLEEIERQSGRRIDKPVHAAAAATPAASGETPTDTCAVSHEPARVADPGRLLQAIENGSESDRYEGLQLVRAEGIPVAPTLLRSLYETDASERVRLAAFEAWLESQSDRPEQLRPALEAALNQSGSAVPAEARRRLDELRQIELVDPADPQAHPSP